MSDKEDLPLILHLTIKIRLLVSEDKQLPVEQWIILLRDSIIPLKALLTNLQSLGFKITKRYLLT